MSCSPVVRKRIRHYRLRQLTMKRTARSHLGGIRSEVVAGKQGAEVAMVLVVVVVEDISTTEVVEVEESRSTGVKAEVTDINEGANNMHTSLMGSATIVASMGT